MCDLVMSELQLSRDALTGLEWTFQELTDNVLNHSEAPAGGVAQAAVFPRNQEIHFIVADAGMGILNSLREGFPALQTDGEAVGEAVKAGVTRNPEFGQGNGLAGSLSIATASHGRLQIVSGQAYFQVFVDGESDSVQERTADRGIDAHYHGTVVYLRLDLSRPFSLVEALNFGEGPHRPIDLVGTKYQTDDLNLSLHVATETVGFGSRESGRSLRNKCMNLLRAEPDAVLVLDWAGVP